MAGPSECVEDIARRIHQAYLASELAAGRAVAYPQPWTELPDAVRRANLAAAHRMGELMTRVGLAVEPGMMTPEQESEAMRRIEGGLEALAEAEHDGWMAQKLQEGWTFGETRDNALQKHPSLAPYRQLPHGEQEKDRNNVRAIPARLREAGMTLTPVADESGHALSERSPI